MDAIAFEAVPIGLADTAPPDVPDSNADVPHETMDAGCDGVANVLDVVRY